tara:strand:- start:15412 stop:15537 length:126 start_codon:yes stop_codon:yes gene_type:complete
MICKDAGESGIFSNDQIAMLEIPFFVLLHKQSGVVLIMNIN